MKFLRAAVGFLLWVFPASAQTAKDLETQAGKPVVRYQVGEQQRCGWWWGGLDDLRLCELNVYLRFILLSPTCLMEAPGNVCLHGRTIY